MIIIYEMTILLPQTTTGALLWRLSPRAQVLISDTQLETTWITWCIPLETRMVSIQSTANISTTSLTPYLRTTYFLQMLYRKCSPRAAQLLVERRVWSP